MKRKFDAEVGKVLQLMIHSVYENHSIFLRELISNASDACEKLRYEAMTHHDLLGDTLEITVKIHKEDNMLTIEDNGIGMSEDELINNLGTIASSGTQKFLETLSSTQTSKQQGASQSGAETSSKFIGQFGVGFYSVFMVAAQVKVYSTKLHSDQTYIWQSDGSGEYEVFPHSLTLKRGTVVELTLKPTEIEYLDKHTIKHIIKTYSDHIAFPIHLIDEEGKIEQINTGQALWRKKPSEITEEEYSDCYHYLAKTPDTPFMTIHTHIEGTVSYTSLLFVPTVKPYDLFHPDRKTRVKLYIKRVFIADDNVSLIPKYLRFLRGVIDSDDLPLNISRESLQHNSNAHKISQSIVKKVLSSLKKKAEEEKEEYLKFWNIFGEVLKEGLCKIALPEKESLLEICRFYSTKSDDDLISLQEYIDRMAEGQNEIYYLTGEKLESLRINPQLEGFKERGIEVLLLKDTVDDFWVNAINQYKNKELQLITRENLNLESVTKENGETNDANQEVQKEDEEVLTYIKSQLGSRVSKVVASVKLVSSPACLSIPDGAMNIKMEKMLMEQKQLSRRSSKILEINTKHPIISRLKSLLSQTHDTLVAKIFRHQQLLLN